MLGSRVKIKTRRSMKVAIWNDVLKYIANSLAVPPIHHNQLPFAEPNSNMFAIWGPFYIGLVSEEKRSRCNVRVEVIDFNHWVSTQYSAWPKHGEGEGIHTIFSKNRKETAIRRGGIVFVLCERWVSSPLDDGISWVVHDEMFSNAWCGQGC